MLEFNYYNISLLVGGFLAFISGIMVLLHSYNLRGSFTWFILTICTSIWSFSYFSMTISNSIELARMSNLILHYAAILIPLVYYLFILKITGRYEMDKIYFYIFSSLAILLISVSHLNVFVYNLVPKAGFNYAPVPGPLYTIFFFYFIVLVLSGIVTSIISICKEKNKHMRVGLIYIIIFTLSASIGGGSVFITTYSVNTPPHLLILFSIYPVISVYTITKHHLFNIKLITVELATFVFWMFMFIRIFFTNSSKDMIIESIIFIFSLALGLALIRSTLREVKQIKKIKELGSDLKNAYSHMKKLDSPADV